MSGDDVPPPDDETPDEVLSDDVNLPEGWFKWFFTHAEVLAKISTKISGSTLIDNYDFEIPALLVLQTL